MRFRSTPTKSTMDEASTPTVKAHPLLQSLRTRKHRYKKAPSKDTIMEVLKGQIIPMFASANPLNQIGSSHSALPSISTPHSKLKTSDSKINFSSEHTFRFKSRRKKISNCLTDKINKINRDTNSIRRKLNSTKNDYSNIKEQISYLKQQIIIAQNYKELIKLKSTYKKKYMNYKFEVFTRTNKIKEQLDGMIKRNETTKEEFNEEKELSLNVYKKEVQVNHWRSVFNLSNIVMGEQLRALFNAAKFKSSTQFTELFTDSNLLNEKEAQLMPKNMMCVQSIDYILSRGILSIFQYKEYLKEIFQVSKKLDKMVASTSEAIFTSRIEIDQISAKTPHLEIEYEILSIEFDKHKKEYLRHRKISTYVEIKDDITNFCKNCGKNYFEFENFEWSCVHHASEFDKVYWCCGATRYLAPGCQKTKHVSPLYNDSEFEDSEDEEPKCTSCLKKGHLFMECPYDPNNFNFNSSYKKYQVMHFEQGSIDESLILLNIK